MMAMRLRMSAELGDWLADLRASEPATAAEVGGALVSLMIADDPSGLPTVRESRSQGRDPREAADSAYQSLLEALQKLRRQVARAATDRKHWADRVEDAAAAGRPADVLAQLRQRLDEAEKSERTVTERSQRLQRDVDSCRTAKETAKAMYTAAEASLRIRDAMEATGDEVADDDLADLNQSLGAAEARINAVAEQAARILRELYGERQPPATIEPAAGLLELRADPLGHDIRVLMALEPAGTVTLLAVLEGPDAVAEHGAQAIELADQLLSDIRAGDWPPADARRHADVEMTFADPATFLARFFPAT